MEKELDLFAEKDEMPLQGKKVIVTGEFDTCSQREISNRLKSYGAELCPFATKNVHFAFVGKTPSDKVTEGIMKLSHNGFRVPIGGEQEVEKIMKGDILWLAKLPEVKKKLDFTINHYNSHRVTFSSGKNIIASKEIFYGKGFSGNFFLFDQITGNLGAFGDNISIYPETNICLLSNSTIENLEQGKKDKTIQYIEDYYNKSDSVTFSYSFLSEKDVLDFCENRCKKCKDTCTLSILQKYKESMA